MKCVWLPESIGVRHNKGDKEVTRQNLVAKGGDGGACKVLGWLLEVLRKLARRCNTLRSDEDRLKLDELMALSTTLQNRVLDLEKTKTTQHNEISSLKRRVKKLEKKIRLRTHKLKRLYKVGLIARVESSDNEKSLDGEEVFVAEQEVVVKDVNNEVNVVEEVVEVINSAKLITDAAQVSAAGNVVSTASDATTISAATTTTATITTIDDKKLQAQEQEELSIKEKATLFQQLLEKRRKHFAAKRNEFGEGKKNKARNIADTREYKEAKSGDDKETAELKQLMKIIPDEEEVVIDAIPLAVKSPSIVDWKIYKEGRKSYYQIMRADGKSQMYMFFSQMLKSFDNEDLKDLYKLVKANYESTRPVEHLDLLLWGDLKTMFEQHVEDKIYMLVEKKYPLAPFTLLMMLEKKLNIDYESEMAYQLLKFIIKQLKK
ncbi:hypothetical protein Tco_0888768 [Tanacetum coccineum]